MFAASDKGTSKFEKVTSKQWQEACARIKPRAARPGCVASKWTITIVQTEFDLLNFHCLPPGPYLPTYVHSAFDLDEMQMRDWTSQLSSHDSSSLKNSFLHAHALFLTSKHLFKYVCTSTGTSAANDVHLLKKMSKVCLQVLNMVKSEGPKNECMCD